SWSMPRWVRWLPPWGTSLLVHLMIVMLLGIWLYATRERTTRYIDTAFGESLTEDLISLEDPRDAGTPVTANLDDALSFAQTPDLRAVSAPVIPQVAHFAPEIASPTLPSNLGADVTGLRSSSIHRENLTAPFSGRLGETKAQLLLREGGTQQSEEAVER